VHQNVSGRRSRVAKAARRPAEVCERRAVRESFEPMPESSPSSDSPSGCDFDAKKLKLKLSVTLAADRKAIDPVVEGVMKVVREMNCANGSEHEIELALSEALANAVVHGASGDPAKIVECDVACDEERGMLIVVRDPGPGFDPSRLPNPSVGENLYSSHGRGIFLINQLMDEVRFHKNGTEIHMIKR
jgi:serine/threonine-protein kinase RsbW